MVLSLFLHIYYFNPLSEELNFCYLSYSAYLISRLAFFSLHNCCFKLRGKVPDVESTCCVFFITALWKKLLIMKYTNRKIKMRRSDFNLKRNTNPNKIEKKESAKINKFEQSIYQNSVINFIIIVLILFSSTAGLLKPSLCKNACNSFFR